MSAQRIVGAGGGGKSGGGGGAKEAPDSLRSSQYAVVVDILSEGEILGLVDGSKSIFMDGVPLVSATGEDSFEGSYSWKAVNGTQVQDHMPHAPVANTEQVGVEVREGISVVRSVSNPDVDWVTVTIGVPGLTEQNTSNGDTNGSSVSYTIEVQSGAGPYVSKVSDTITGKTTTRYQRSHKLMLTGDAPWNIRVTRTTPDAVSSAINNKTFWDLMTTGIDVKLMYSNSAAVMMRIDAALFDSVPTRGYHIRGMIVMVPTNYNPATRAYTGSWDGSFKYAYTNNPAWCFFDICTQNRYGLGEFIGFDGVDKWTMYTIAKYCDEMVPDGFGGMEPRFTCNLYLQTRQDAFRVLSDMASIFRGMLYHANSMLMAAQDAPSDPVAMFNDTNVANGIFNRQGADRRARHTVALVSWNDPADQYRQKIEYVQDDEGVRRWGIIEAEITSIGCTSRGQAHRAGKWLIYTERYESETISFSAGMDAARLAPGEVFQVQDSVYAGARMGGRILPTSTASVIELDAPVEILPGETYMITVMMPNGLPESRNISNAPGTTQAVNLIAPLSAVPADYAIWMLGATTLQLETWRAISIKESNEGPFVEISGVYHHPGKFDAVENDMVLEPVPQSIIPSRPGQVTQIDHRTENFMLNNGAYSTRIAISWKNPATAASCDVTWRRDNENPQTIEARGQGVNIDNVVNGVYKIRILPRDPLGRAGEAVEFEHVVSSSDAAAPVGNLRLDPSFNGPNLPFTWDIVPGAKEYEIELMTAPGGALLRTAKVNFNQYVYTYAMNIADGGPRRSLHVRMRAHTLTGVSPTWTLATFDNPSPVTPGGIEVISGPGQVSIMATRSPDEDLAGMIVWMDTTAAFTPTAGNKVYQGPDNAHTQTGLEPGIAKYFKVAFYDTFGTTGVNISTSLVSTPGSLGGVAQVTELPANPEAIGGELALFLNVADANERGLYGWDGTAWVNTKELTNGSVTSDKLAPGAVLAQNTTIRKHFIY